MDKKIDKSIIIFNNKSIRRHWDDKKEEWYFSVVDIIRVLTNNERVRKYWNDLKAKLKQEGSELSEKIGQLKLISNDGKKYLTDVADIETVFRLIQSIPSPKVEPFKLWLAQAGRERIDETIDPEKTINRAMQTYLRKGYTKEWINQRLKSIEVRKDLTNEWENRGVKDGSGFAILTDEITKAWTGGLKIKDYKKFKGLKKENLRDNMTNIELVLNMLAEATTTEISKKKEPKTFKQNRIIAKEGGEVAGNARKEIEKKTGDKVITDRNEKQLRGGRKNKIRRG